MPPSAAAAGAPGAPGRRGAPAARRGARRLRVADVALFYGERSGGIRTYLDAKVRHAAETGAFDHHVIVPGRRERHLDGRHELRSLRVAAANGYRLPFGARSLKATLAAIRPDVVLLHDPFWAALGVTRAAHELGARVVAVHHASSALNAAGLPGPDRLLRPAFRAWFHHAYAGVDAVMSVVDPEPDSGRPASIPLRFGLHPAFRPRPWPGAGTGVHVLYAGRLSREKGVFELLEAAALAGDPWPLRLLGSGPARDALEHRAERLGIGHRVSFAPYLANPLALARAYAQSACVVMAGAHETFGLVALEAAASGARTVACRTAPSAALAGGLVETFEPGDAAGLAAAIDRARRRAPDAAAAAALAERCSWPAAFAAELEDLRRLAG